MEDGGVRAFGPRDEVLRSDGAQRRNIARPGPGPARTCHRRRHRMTRPPLHLTDARPGTAPAGPTTANAPRRRPGPCPGPPQLVGPPVAGAWHRQPAGAGGRLRRMGDAVAHLGRRGLARPDRGRTPPPDRPAPRRRRGRADPCARRPGGQGRRAADPPGRRAAAHRTVHRRGPVFRNPRRPRPAGGRTRHARRPRTFPPT